MDLSEYMELEPKMVEALKENLANEIKFDCDHNKVFAYLEVLHDIMKDRDFQPFRLEVLRELYGQEVK